MRFDLSYDEWAVLEPYCAASIATLTFALDAVQGGKNGLSLPHLTLLEDRRRSPSLVLDEPSLEGKQFEQSVKLLTEVVTRGVRLPLDSDHVCPSGGC